jgi:hypothetical protein
MDSHRGCRRVVHTKSQLHDLALSGSILLADRVLHAQGLLRCSYAIAITSSSLLIPLTSNLPHADR